MFGHTCAGEEGLRVVIPKARRGIHELNSNMDKSEFYHTAQNSSEVQDSYDEVDHIMSKLVRSSSPLTVRKPYPRRSSVDAKLYDDENDDSSSEDMLSKSSPAEFQIHSYYRDENDQHINSNRDVSHSISWQTHSRSSDTNIPEPQSKTNNGSNSNYTIYFAIVIALVGICYIVYQNYSNKILRKEGFEIYDRIKFHEDLRSMTQKYKVKPDSMLQVRTGVDTIFQKEDTGSFIFTYDSTSFDPELFNHFIDNISSAASRYLRNDTKDVQHIVLDNSKVITIKSDVDLIYEYRDNLDKTGVLLVKNVEKVPPKLAMAFHYYCDEFNPLVKKSAIFFTLDVAKCKSPLLSKVSLDHDYIERCLKDKWSKIDTDKMEPLLTRVVGVIVDVTNI